MSHALCAPNNLILNGPCWSFHYIFEIFFCCARKFVSMEIFLWAMCWRYFLARSNEEHSLAATRTHTQREGDIGRLLLHLTSSHLLLYPHTYRHTCHSESIQTSYMVPTHTQRDSLCAEIHSFVFNEQKSVIAFSASQFSIWRFSNGNFFPLFVLPPSLMRFIIICIWKADACFGLYWHSHISFDIQHCSWSMTKWHTHNNNQQQQQQKQQ